MRGTGRVNTCLYPLNENKLQLQATFEDWGCEVAKQLLNVLAVFEPEPIAT